MSAPAPRRSTGPKPDWRSVTWEALIGDAAFARVLAGMGFTRHFFTADRGQTECWPADYAACPATSPHRETIAANNRARRDAGVHFVADETTLFMVEAYPPGQWRTKDGAQQGDDLISLGMLRWDCRYGQAATRISRLIGLRVIPTAQPIAPGDLFKGASWPPAPALPVEQGDA